MAEPISIQQLKDASLDVKSLEEVVNGDENVVVTTRLGETYPSVKGSIKKVFENGGLPATPFTTKALMTASALVDGKYAIVTDDTLNNGLYVKTAGAWVKSDYDPLAQAKAYTDTNKADTLSKVQNTFDTKALMTASPLPDGSKAFVGSDTTSDNNGFYKKTAGIWGKVAYNPVPKNELVQKGVTEADYTFDGVGIDTRNGLSYGGNASYKATGYIAIEPDVSYQTTTRTGNSFYGGAWYDLNKNYISGFSAETLTTVISPKNAAYVRLSFGNFYAGIVALFEPTQPRVNIENVTNIIESRTPAPEPKAKEVVYSQSELDNLNPYGKNDRAYPIGRRVYDHSLRKEVVADGSFWRLPDGTAAALAERVYVYPDWDEMRAALPRTAKAYRKVFDANNPRIEEWKSTTTSKAILESVEVDGKKYLSIDGNSGGGYMYLENTAVVLNQHLVCKIKFNLDTVGGVNIGLLSATGEILFSNAFSGTELLSQTYGTLRLNRRLDTFTSRKEGATLADVAYIGFRVSTKPGQTGSILLDAIETVTYKPKITLRFDDNKPSVYTNGYPILQQYGFRGLIAVIVNQAGLANDPDFPILDDSITKEGLLELRSLGWDLVSHTYSDDTGYARTDAYMRESYKRSRDYLRNELNAGMIASSCLISPRAVRDLRLASIQREFYDCQINKVGLNSQLLRQPEGFWEGNDLWTTLSGDNGDNYATGEKLIGYAQKAIDEGGWSILMMHRVGVPDENFSTSIEALSELCAWLDSHRDEIDVVTVSDVVREIRPDD